MSKTTEAIVAVLTAIVGVAIVSVLVSQQAQTASVITAAGNAFSSILGVAVSPVTGNTGNINTGSAISSAFGF